MNLNKNNKKGNIESLKEKPFKLEREIQTLFENNLKELMYLQLVKSEFSIKNIYVLNYLNLISILFFINHY